MKKIMIDASKMGTYWVGGLYYCANMAFVLSQNDYIMSHYKVIVCSDKEHKALFKGIDGIQVVWSRWNNRFTRKTYSVLYSIIHRVNFFYWKSRSLKRLMMQEIAWIPDFQHKHYPMYFTEQEINTRDNKYIKTAQSKSPLVLSSNSCLDDFKKFYSSTKKNVYVVPFVSYIIPMINTLTPTREEETLSKYNLLGKKYVCIFNQFWQHKNHKVVFDAIENIQTEKGKELIYIFTGKMEDYRNPDYIIELKERIKKISISAHIKMLGFISREEQIVLLKRAQFVIQPSLFEGWGTVVEDAKTMDKTILLSDIPVHREQMNRKCILFDPYDSKGLAKLIEQEMEKDRNDDIDNGIIDMYNRAKKYSLGFEQLLRNYEKKEDTNE